MSIASYEVDDDQYPASAVVYIRSTWGSSVYVGSGALIGRNDVLTASHVIYDQTLGGLADNIEVLISYDPDSNFNSNYSAVRANYYTDFDPNGDGQIFFGDGSSSSFAGAEIDIAILTLDQDVGRFGYFGLQTGFNTGDMGVLGHPTAYLNNMRYDRGYVYKDSVDNTIHISSLEISSGSSGGPVYGTYNGDQRIVGVVSTDAAATSIDAHYDWILDTINNNDSYIETTTSPSFPTLPTLPSPTPPTVVAPDDGNNTPGGTEVVYRFYNPGTQSHYFAVGENQLNTISNTNPTWLSEGAAFEAPTTQADGTVPVYRMYNTESGRFLFTANSMEISIVQTQGWTIDQENVWFVSAFEDVAAGFDSAMYRMYVPAISGHVYSANQNEIDILISTLGAVNEGVAYYV